MHFQRLTSRTRSIRKDLQLPSNSNNTIILDMSQVMSRSDIRPRNTFTAIQRHRSASGCSAARGGEACSCSVEPEGEQGTQGCETGGGDTEAEFDDGDDSVVWGGHEQVLQLDADDIDVGETHDGADAAQHSQAENSAYGDLLLFVHLCRSDDEDGDCDWC